MRIHSDIITNRHILDAASTARVSLDRWLDKGSKKRDHAFDITLTGESKRRPNNRGNHGGDFAATWDQWGVFLAALFAVDENMLTPYYDDAADFAFKTADRFGAPEVVMGDLPVAAFTTTTAPRTLVPRRPLQTRSGYVDKFVAYGWPDDAHGDHTFRYSGTPREQSCTKCSAKQRWTI